MILNNDLVKGCLMKKELFLSLLFCALSSTCFADYTRAVAALQRADYATALQELEAPIQAKEAKSFPLP